MERIVPGLPSVPVQPLLESTAEEYGMFEHFKKYPWVMELRRYKDVWHLLEEFGEKIISPIELKLAELRNRERNR